MISFAIVVSMNPYLEPNSKIFKYTFSKELTTKNHKHYPSTKYSSSACGKLHQPKITIFSVQPVL